MEYILNQFLSETFALGVQGFYNKQITGDSGNGAILGGFKGEAKRRAGEMKKWSDGDKEMERCSN